MDRMTQTSPTADRARETIGEVLKKFLPPSGRVLEVGSGTGELALYLARTLPSHTWQPSDVDAAAIASITAHVADTALENLLPPLELDVSSQPWPVSQIDAVIAIDLVHVIPWDAVLQLFFGASRAMLSGGLLYLYGAFRFSGRYTAKANEELDVRLRANNDQHGLRDIRELTVAGTRTGFGLERTLAMADDRHSLVFRRRQLLPPSGQFQIG